MLGKYTNYNVLKSEDADITITIQREFEGYYLDREIVDEDGNFLYVFENMKNPGDSMTLTKEEAYEEKSAEI